MLKSKIGTCRPRVVLACVLASLVCDGVHAGGLSSYAASVQDSVGVTGSASAALGPPDYVFVNDVAFGGENSEVFDVGESAVFFFEIPLRNVPGEDDLLISAFVGGEGSADNAEILAEVSCDGKEFSSIATINTGEARLDPFEGPFEGVKHFSVDFGTADCVRHVRLTNTAGTAEGLRLDAIEGLHPRIRRTHAFEWRLDRYREDTSERFLIRVKNIGDADTGTPIAGFTIGRDPDPITGQDEWMEETANNIYGAHGEFFSTIGSVGDADGPDDHGASFAKFEWSDDGGESVAPVGTGLEPGHTAAHQRFENLDLDTPETTFLADFEFSVEFADGFVHSFNWNDDITSFGQSGALYQKSGYYSETPGLSGPRPTYYYESIDNDGVVEDVCTSCPMVPGNDDGLGDNGDTSNEDGTTEPADGSSGGNSTGTWRPASRLCGTGMIGSFGFCLIALLAMPMRNGQKDT